MTQHPPSLDERTLQLSVDAFYELADALHALCARLQRNDEPLDPDCFERVLILVGSMHADAVRLCESTQVLDAAGSRPGSSRIDSATYEALGQALRVTRDAAKALLELHRPLMGQHADAISLLTRIAAASRVTSS